MQLFTFNGAGFSKPSLAQSHDHAPHHHQGSAPNAPWYKRPWWRTMYTQAAQVRAPSLLLLVLLVAQILFLALVRLGPAAPASRSAKPESHPDLPSRHFHAGNALQISKSPPRSTSSDSAPRQKGLTVTASLSIPDGLQDDLPGSTGESSALLSDQKSSSVKIEENELDASSAKEGKKSSSVKIEQNEFISQVDASSAREEGNSSAEGGFEGELAVHGSKTELSVGEITSVVKDVNSRPESTAPSTEESSISVAEKSSTLSTAAKSKVSAMSEAETSTLAADGEISVLTTIDESNAASTVPAVAKGELSVTTIDEDSAAATVSTAAKGEVSVTTINEDNAASKIPGDDGPNVLEQIPDAQLAATTEENAGNETWRADNASKTPKDDANLTSLKDDAPNVLEQVSNERTLSDSQILAGTEAQETSGESGGREIRRESISSSSFSPSSSVAAAGDLLESIDVGGDGECKNGYVFVYDLPRIFNHDIVSNCSALNPWANACPTVANGGLGESLGEASPLGQAGSWYISDQFTSEMVFHNRMLQHPCLTDKAEQATALYVPFYAGLDVGRYLWGRDSRRDRLSRKLLKWLGKQEAWKRRGGRDHFMMIGRVTWDFRREREGDWGSAFFRNPSARNLTRLLVERNPWEVDGEGRTEVEMAVPYPTNFHPQSDADLRAWQSHLRSRLLVRATLFSFAGARRSQFPHDFRALLLEQCSSSSSCRALECSSNDNISCDSSSNSSPKTTLELFLDSVFCLQPRGDSFTRRSTFDCMLAGSIPVFFWRRSAYLQYMWHLPDDHASYSVFIPKEAIRNGTSVEQVLRSLPSEKVRAMQETIIQLIPRIVYAASGFSLKEEKDAFDLAVDGVMRSFKQGSAVL